MQILFDAWHLRRVSKGGGIARDTAEFFKALSDEFELKFVSYDVDTDFNQVETARRYRRKFVRAWLFCRKPFDIKFETNIFWIPQIGSVWNSKAKVVYVRIHDVLPLTHPEFFTFWQRNYFKRFVNLLDSDKVVLVCNSNSTGIELNEIDFKNNPRVTRIYCTASELDATRCLSCKACLALSKLPQNFDLMVGTLEPRKNYLFAAKIYKSVNRKVVIVGRVGWKSKLTEKILSANPNVIRLPDCCDGALAELYRTCENFVSTSFAEGFNLPAAEAYLYKKNLVLSDIPVHREIYPNAELIDLNDLERWHIVLKNEHNTKQKSSSAEEIDFSFSRFQNEVKQLLSQYEAK